MPFPDKPCSLCDATALRRLYRIRMGMHLTASNPRKSSATLSKIPLLPLFAPSHKSCCCSSTIALKDLVFPCRTNNACFKVCMYIFSEVSLVLHLITASEGKSRKRTTILQGPIVFCTQRRSKRTPNGMLLNGQYQCLSRCYQEMFDANFT